MIPHNSVELSGSDNYRRAIEALAAALIQVATEDAENGYKASEAERQPCSSHRPESAMWQNVKAVFRTAPAGSTQQAAEPKNGEKKSKGA